MVNKPNPTSEDRCHHIIPPSQDDVLLVNDAHNHNSVHAGKHSHTHTETKAVLNRLSKVIGHLKATRWMVEDGRDCAEVLMQLAAVRSAISSICKIILKDHIDHCIVDAVKTGDMETIEELNKAIEILMKSI